MPSFTLQGITNVFFPLGRVLSLYNLKVQRVFFQKVFLALMAFNLNVLRQERHTAKVKRPGTEPQRFQSNFKYSSRFKAFNHSIPCFNPSNRDTHTFWWSIYTNLFLSSVSILALVSHLFVNLFWSILFFLEHISKKKGEKPKRISSGANLCVIIRNDRGENVLNKYWKGDGKRKVKPRDQLKSSID